MSDKIKLGIVGAVGRGSSFCSVPLQTPICHIILIDNIQTAVLLNKEIDVKYEKPEVIDFKWAEAMGTCIANGSGDSTNCYSNGNSAGADCDSNGNSPGGGCSSAGNGVA